MDFIYNHLQENNDKTLWVYEEKLDLFNKYTQIPVSSSPDPPSSVLLFEVKKQEIIEKPKKEERKNKESPLDLIIKHTLTNKIMKNEIKQKLVEFITIPEFSKAFGVKKSAEIISALTRDSWNQSVVLFISFLLNANVIYKEKSYLFNKEKNLQEITIHS
jgi:hypothetical protein